MKYPKIQTLFDRGEKSEGYKVIEGKYRLPEFEMLDKWEVTEKVDGTNIRVIYETIDEVVGMAGMNTIVQPKGKRVRFAGRKEKSQIPTPLLNFLKETFTVEVLEKAFPRALIGNNTVTVFGEGYGAGINGGGSYRTGNDHSFRTFDVYVEDPDHPMGGWWLESENIKDIASKLGIETVPIFGMWTTEHIVNFIKKGLETDHAFSHVQQEENDNFMKLSHQKDMEGLIARSKPLLFTRKGERLMFKLKLSDFPRD